MYFSLERVETDVKAIKVLRINFYACFDRFYFFFNLHKKKNDWKDRIWI